MTDARRSNDPVCGEGNSTQMSVPMPPVGEAKVDPPDFAETLPCVGVVAAAVATADGLTSCSA